MTAVREQPSDYFRDRGLSREIVKAARIGRENGALYYPVFDVEGRRLALHHKGVVRDGKGKRRQWWGGYADALLPVKENGKPAKVIPFGLETLKGLEPGSPVVLCCGEEDALSLRQIGQTALSQPGAGLLEPVYAREMKDFAVTVFYDAGEEREARKDALKLLEAGARNVRVAAWPPDAKNGADVNGRLVEDPESFGEWVAAMISEAEAVSGEEPPVLAERRVEPDSYITEPSPTPWPVLSEGALYGLSGEVVSRILPHTEADAAALLVNFLVGFGNAAGRGAHVKVGAARHGLNLFAVLVGETSKARKGSSWGFIRDLLHAADPFWAEDRVMGGLSSGEGLIFHVRDSVTGVDKEGGLVVRDEGAPDKRLLALETEFGGPLKVATREGNTLSVLIRQSWDGGKLATLTRNSPLKSSDPHVSIIGHVTRAELLNSLSETDTMGGLSNRFLWCMVRRSKLLPFGGGWGKVDVAPLMRRLSEALDFAREIGELRWGGTARDLWGSVYAELSEGKPGLLGAATSRAEAQVLRLAALYAVLDLSSSIEAEHLEAALAVWRYAEGSARFIFGDATGNPIADRIAAALEEKPDGMSRTEVRDLFKRHQSKARLDGALALLEKSGKARRETAETTGRPSERWFSR